LLLGGTNVNAISGAIYKNLGFEPVRSFAPVAMIYTDSLALALSRACRPIHARNLSNTPRIIGKAEIRRASRHLHAVCRRVLQDQNLNRHSVRAVQRWRAGADRRARRTYRHDIQQQVDRIAVLQGAEAEAACRDQPKPLAGAAGNADLSGVKISGFPTEVIFGLLAPAGTPLAIIGRLNGAVNDGLRSAEVRASLDAIGVEARMGTPQEFAAMLDEQARQWKAVIDEIGIKAE